MTRCEYANVLRRFFAIDFGARLTYSNPTFQNNWSLLVWATTIFVIRLTFSSLLHLRFMLPIFSPVFWKESDFLRDLRNNPNSKWTMKEGKK